MSDNDTRPAFTLTDTSTGQPVFGLVQLPADNASLMRLTPVAGDRPWQELGLDESACVRDLHGDIYRIVRVR